MKQSHLFWKASLMLSWSTRTTAFAMNRGSFGTRRSFGASTIDTAESATSTMVLPSEKLEQLREQMKERNIDVLIVPSDDPHLSEYTPKAYQRRAFLTGFTGSAGTAVVTLNEAHLWTDSRYWNEAGMQLDQEQWTLQKQGLSTTLPIPKFIAEHIKKDDKELVISWDPYCQAFSFRDDIDQALKDTSYKVDTSHSNLVDAIWTDRPAIPTAPFRVHPLKYAGVSAADKIQQVRDQHDGLAVLSALDDVAYLLNLRAMGDIDTCPVGLAYATISPDACTLYCDPAKVSSPEVQEHLKAAHVTVKPYDDIVPDVQDYIESRNEKVWLDGPRCNAALGDSVPPERLHNAPTAVALMKACKNDAELKGMRQAHVVDGVAMAHFIAWLETTLQERSVSEVEIDLVLTNYRAQQEGFLECSFPTIAGVGSNGAIVHYRAQEDSPLLQHLDKSQPILIDSGGQYEYGTTDVTRTWHFGQASDEFREYYTRVLKGHIGVDSRQFPVDTPGFVLDVYARQALWEIGKDYGHGTGHGVGAALNVHEGPASISPRWTNTQPILPGMVLSNEPGFYQDGSFGIRIENLLEVQTVPGRPVSDGDKEFLQFQALTLIPIQQNLIQLELLTDFELDWLNQYHVRVFETISPHLSKDSAALEWLERSCRPLER